MSENILFGQYGDWINVKFDAEATETKTLVDSLIPFDYALIEAFIYFIFAKKGYEPKFDEKRENLELKSSNFLNPSECVEAIIEIKEKAAFVWERGEIIKQMDPGHIPGEVSIDLPEVKFSDCLFEISFSSDEEFENYKEIAEKCGEERKDWAVEVISHLKEISEEEISEDIKKIMRKKNKTSEESEIERRMYNALAIFTENEEGPNTELLEEILREKDEKEGTIKLFNLLSKYGHIPPFVFVDPRIADRDYASYVEIKEQLRSKYGWDLLKTDTNLINEFIEEDKRSEVSKEWETIRNEAIEQIEEEVPLLEKFLVLVFEKSKFEAIQYRLWNKIPEMIDRSQFREAMLEVGITCEEIISILYHDEFKKGGSFNKTLMLAEKRIIEEYSKSVYHDLYFILQQRNTAAHPQGMSALVAFNKKLAQEALLRAQVFYCMLKSRHFGITPNLRPEN